MEIRPITPADLDAIREIDGTIESADYLHLEQSGEAFNIVWKIELRPLRQKLIQSNPISDQSAFLLKQIATGADEGIAILAEHEQLAVGLLLAQPNYEARTLELIDLRIDYEHRREGLATAMLFQTIQRAREMELRAVVAETRTNNLPANQLLLKSSFDLSGIDTRRLSNHDIVKESATLIWYAALD
jgi:ribosomal protein S18 acetylase RimI-like enzyme